MGPKASLFSYLGADGGHLRLAVLTRDDTLALREAASDANHLLRQAVASLRWHLLRERKDVGRFQAKGLARPAHAPRYRESA